MKFTEDPREPLPRPDRPIGVTILATLDGISAGFIPALVAILQISAVANQAPEQVSVATLCLAVGLPVAIVTASIGAFLGYDRARLALLVLITLYYGLNAFQNLTLVAAEALPDDQQVLALGRVAAAAFWIGINAWYFLRPSTVAFYRRPLSPVQ